MTGQSLEADQAHVFSDPGYSLQKVFASCSIQACNATDMHDYTKFISQGVLYHSMEEVMHNLGRIYTYWRTNGGAPIKLTRNKVDVKFCL